MKNFTLDQKITIERKVELFSPLMENGISKEEYGWSDYTKQQLSIGKPFGITQA